MSAQDRARQPAKMRTLIAFTVLTRAQALAPPTAPPPSILSIGETLYDSLPNGVFLGGAPLNVAVHAAQLGAHSVYASAVGDDALRDAVVLLEHSSLDLAPAALRAAAGGEVSVFSVDGCHTFACARSDLELAWAVLAPRGHLPPQEHAVEDRLMAVQLAPRHPATVGGCRPSARRPPAPRAGRWRGP